MLQDLFVIFNVDHIGQKLSTDLRKEKIGIPKLTEKSSLYLSVGTPLGY